MNKDLFRLRHIIECINKIEILVNILRTYENFEKKWIEQDAVIRSFEVIGEASNHISENLKQQNPKVAWKEMKGMRNFITHEYFGLQLDSIWDTAKNDIPVLKDQIQHIIDELE